MMDSPAALMPSQPVVAAWGMGLDSAAMSVENR